MLDTASERNSSAAGVFPVHVYSKYVLLKYLAIHGCFTEYIVFTNGLHAVSDGELHLAQDGPEGAVESGHLGEIQRWTEHAQNLASLLEQFQEESLHSVLKILNAAKSSYAKPFQCVTTRVALSSCTRSWS